MKKLAAQSSYSKTKKEHFLNPCRQSITQYNQRANGEPYHQNIDIWQHRVSKLQSENFIIRRNFKLQILNLTKMGIYRYSF